MRVGNAIGQKTALWHNSSPKTRFPILSLSVATHRQHRSMPQHKMVFGSDSHWSHESVSLVANMFGHWDSVQLGALNGTDVHVDFESFKSPLPLPLSSSVYTNESGREIVTSAPANFSFFFSFFMVNTDLLNNFGYISFFQFRLVLVDNASLTSCSDKCLFYSELHFVFFLCWLKQFLDIFLFRFGIPQRIQYK